ncbi:MAG: NAD dependent epimerase/dehydratase family enzyme [Bacteroidia bacterium]|jgi:NAD dependent epimerase/dehydratase family enzyme
MMQLLRDQLNVPFGLATPAWLLKIGAIFIRTETELVLKSRWVQPTRLQKSQYDFRFDKLEDALQDLLP